MIKKQSAFQDLPIEEGKSYVTRFQTGEVFFVKRVKLHPNVSLNPRPVLGYEGIYWAHKHLGICPLAVDRLIPEKIPADQIYVCDSCSKPVDLEEIVKEVILSMNSEEFNELKMREDYGWEKGRAIKNYLKKIMNGK